MGDNRVHLFFTLSTFLTISHVFWLPLGSQSTWRILVILCVRDVCIINERFLFVPYRSASWILWQTSAAEGQLSVDLQVTVVASVSFMSCSGCCDLVFDFRLQSSFLTPCVCHLMISVLS